MKKKSKPVKVKDLKPVKGPKGGRITNTRGNISTVGGGAGVPTQSS